MACFDDVIKNRENGCAHGQRVSGSRNWCFESNFIQITGADSGFPVRGAPTYDLAKFSIKLHEIEKKLGRG